MSTLSTTDTFYETRSVNGKSLSHLTENQATRRTTSFRAAEFEVTPVLGHPRIVKKEKVP